MSYFNGNLNSDYFKAYYLGRKRIVFVENEMDVPFWRKWLREFAPNEHFVIKPSVRGTSERGKRILLEQAAGTGEFMLLAVDSDYDYILQQYTADARLVNNNRFILQTYTYSVENYLCYAESLAELCVAASLNDELPIDPVDFLQRYSQIIFPLFLYSIHAERTDKVFTRREFSTAIRLNSRFKIDNQGQVELEKLETIVQQKINDLATLYPNVALQDIETELIELGIVGEQTYLFVNGHVIFDDVTLNLLSSIVYQMRQQKHAIFRQEAANSEEVLMKISEYKRQLQRRKTDQLLAQNTEYKACFPLQWLKNDIEALFSNPTISPAS